MARRNKLAQSRVYGAARAVSEGNARKLIGQTRDAREEPKNASRHGQRPVEPKPPAPRAVVSSSETSVDSTGGAGSKSICAMRSPCVT